MLYFSMLVSWNYLVHNNRFSSANIRPGGRVQRNTCLATTTVQWRQTKELGHLCATAGLCVQFPNPRFQRRLTFLSVLSQHTTGPTTIDSHTAQPPDADNVTNGAERILEEFAAMCTRVCGTLAQQQARYKCF